MKTIKESIIGRKSSKIGEIIYIFWPKWMDGVDCLRKSGFVELESEKYGFIFLIAKSDLKNNEDLLNKTKAAVYRSKKTDTIPNVIRKLKDFIDSNMDPRSVFADAGFEFLHW